MVIFSNATNQIVPHISISIHYINFSTIIFFSYTFISYKHSETHISSDTHPLVLSTLFLDFLSSIYLPLALLIVFHSFTPHGMAKPSQSWLTYCIYYTPFHFTLLSYFVIQNTIISCRSSYIFQVSHLHYTQTLLMPFILYPSFTSIHQCLN